jgi:hypothetical protein
VCCDNGACAANVGACGGGLLSVGTGEPASLPPTLTPVEAWYATYAHTRCRVLSECGDGTEQPCAPGGAEPDAECVELNCCAVSGIPP